MRFLERVVLTAMVCVAGLQGMRARAEELTPGAVEESSSASLSMMSTEGAASAGFERGVAAKPPDPCWASEVTASPSRPYWDAGAATTPCGNVETDFGVVVQPMGGGVWQRLLVSSVRYGLTPKLDFRWGVTNQIVQSGGGLGQTVGVGDHSVSMTFRFHEQGRRSPALALSYGASLPVANPAKGFGSGFSNDQLAFIASRDVGGTHVDINVVGALEGGANGHEGAAQFGMALTRPVTRRLAWIAESFGGAQPGTTDRFGAVLTGGSFAARPWLVLDGAVTRTYTAGSPRWQIQFGLTCARRPGWVLIPRGSRIGRLLGR